MRFRIFLLFLVLTMGAQGQTQLAEAKLSLTDSLNKIALGNTANDLPVILINAFKKGELKAFKFAFQKQPVYGDLKQWPNPKNWIASGIYDENDSVLYKGKLYRYMFRRNDPGVIHVAGLTPDIAPDAYGINDYWKEYKRLPPVIGMNYILPTEKDLLKVENWEDIKSKAITPMPYWDPQKYFFTGDIVTYQGKTYEATQDNVKSMPTNQNDWQLTYRGVSDDVFTELQFVYNSETRLPITFQLALGTNGEICIGFYLEAVQKYLIEAKQEVLADKLVGLMREKAH